MSVLDATKVELETARKIFWLLAHDYIFLSSYSEESKDWDDGTYPAINCNDIFVPAADAETLSAEDLELYVRACRAYGDMAAAAWCSVKRSARPWRQMKDDAKFDEAVAGIAAMFSEVLIS